MPPISTKNGGSLKVRSVKKSADQEARLLTNADSRAQKNNFNKLGRAGEVAVYYGFMPIKPPEINKGDRDRAKSVLEGETGNKNPDCPLSICPEEKIAILRLYAEKKMEHLPQPVTLYIDGPILNVSARRKPLKEKHLGLEIIGTSKSIAEAILIKTATEILKEEGYTNLIIKINSIGDKECIARFARELGAYYRKNLEELPTHCRQTMKQDLFELLECQNEKCCALKNGAPKSISFLSEENRDHFKEVLEYLEMLELPYVINNTLVGHRSFCSQTLFEIHDASGPNEPTAKALALGIRYNYLAKKIGFKKDLPSIGVHLAYKPLTKESKSKASQKIAKPKIYFVQLGFEAKLKSLKIIETMRREKIPMYQSLSRDKLISQLALAESMKIPYTIIMGQKEALENSVIVRNMTNRSQETVSIADLPNYVRKIK